VKLTKHQTEQATLAAMLHAMDRRFPVTITYLKEEKDAAGRKTGRLVETVRTVEIHSYQTTKAGNVILRAADRETGEMRTWRLDRIHAYTTHRTTYVVPAPADEAPAPRPALSTPAALIAFEIGRDERPARRHLQPAA
jgi:predicted DNA-binding transcriptional regulator YafY